MTESEFEKMVEQKFDSYCKSVIEIEPKCPESGREPFEASDHVGGHG